MTLGATLAPAVDGAGRQRRALAVWALVFVAAWLLLLGRYDWSAPNRRFAERGWLLSGYLCCLLLPVGWGLLRRATDVRWLPEAVTGLAFVVLTLPYRWLGLERWFYYRARPLPWYNPPDDVAFPRPQFLPGGPWSTFPGSVWLFTLAIVATVAAVVAGCRWRLRRGRGGQGNRGLVAGGALVVVVLVQSFLHSGVRGPYVYMTHYQGPPRPSLWYAVAHFGDGNGVSIADQFVFSAIEQYFHGVAVDPNNMLIRRPSAFYVSAQFSYFVNTYYVWTALNIALWVAAVLAGYGFARRLVGARVAGYFAAMIAVGPGFVAFVGTPAMYLAGYAVVIIALFLAEWLLVDPDRPGPADFALFAGALACCALTYDLTVTFPVLGGYLVLRKVPWRPTLAALVAAYVLYRGFLFAHNSVLGLHVVDTNTAQLDRATERVREVAGEPSQWFGATRDALGAYVVMLGRMFFYVPIVLALPGIYWLRDRAQQFLVVGLLAVTLATVAFFRVGGEVLGWLPRFTYPAYPAIYLLAALGLDGLTRAWATRAPQRAVAVRAAPWAVLAVLTLLANVDVLGHPRLYYEALEGTRMYTFLTRDDTTGEIVAVPQ
jgi:hypothetical protein